MARSPPLAGTPFTEYSASQLTEAPVTKDSSSAAMACATEHELFAYRTWQFRVAVERRAGRRLSDDELRCVFKDPAFLRMEAEQEASLAGYSMATADAKTDTAKSPAQVFEARKAAYKKMLERRVFGHALDDEQLAALFDSKVFAEVEAEDHAKLRAMTQDAGHSADINTLMMLAAAHRDHEEKSTMLTDSYAGLFEELRTWTAQSGWNTSRPGVHPSEVLQTRSDGSGLDSMKAGFQKAFGNGAAKCNRKKGRSKYAAGDTSAVPSTMPASVSASASMSLSAGVVCAGPSIDVPPFDGGGSSIHAKADERGAS